MGGHDPVDFPFFSSTQSTWHSLMIHFYTFIFIFLNTNPAFSSATAYSSWKIAFADSRPVRKPCDRNPFSFPCTPPTVCGCDNFPTPKVAMSKLMFRVRLQIQQLCYNYKHPKWVPKFSDVYIWPKYDKGTTGRRLSNGVCSCIHSTCCHVSRHLELLHALWVEGATSAMWRFG